jgi:hypothetical protein
LGGGNGLRSFAPGAGGSDIAVGHDNLFNGDRYKWSLRFTVINLTDKTALYNFYSTFSGTHYVTPRTETVELGSISEGRSKRDSSHKKRSMVRRSSLRRPACCRQASFGMTKVVSRAENNKGKALRRFFVAGLSLLGSWLAAT